VLGGDEQSGSQSRIGRIRCEVKLLGVELFAVNRDDGNNAGTDVEGFGEFAYFEDSGVRSESAQSPMMSLVEETEVTHAAGCLRTFNFPSAPALPNIRGRGQK